MSLTFRETLMRCQDISHAILSVCVCLHLKVDTEVERWILSNRDKAFDDRAALTYLT